ncbi:MAG: signal peptidase I [Bacteroidales bacterium]|nr:signal peptidase I [Candidatus Sodaliphilus limicaballi]
MSKTSDKKANGYNPQTGSLKERLGRVKPTRWARFGIVSVIFFVWVFWLGNWWVALAWFLLADIYLTQFIPYTWWKGIKNNAVRKVFSWIDAIVYAMVLVYFLFSFVGQNFTIPSSSLEKTLLTGDFLWVNKMVYGPRVPQTPLHIPVCQNMIPFLNCKSYFETPQLDYHRLNGVRSVERGDIVVFNFPAGDTVALNCPNPDYYTLVQIRGREVVNSNRDMFGEVIYRPVDRRDAYVKRCLGLPGEWFSMKDGVVYIDGKALDEPENVQFNYIVVTDGTAISDETFDELGVSVDDRGFNGQFYELPLTKDMVAQLKSYPWVKTVERITDQHLDVTTENVISFPVGQNYGWTHNNMGRIWIPKKGKTLHLTLENLPKYERCIKNYEGNTLEVKEGKIYINGKETTTYTFKMDYYWMMGDNRDNSLDSRFWGFVPEDHIIGTPHIVLISFDKDKRGLGVRWNRIFKTPNPDKK